MKKLFLSTILVFASSSVFAGGLMTNTNYHIAFDRMFARGASTEIDAVFSNPAGLAWGHEGLQFSLNFQKPWQNRDIEYGGKTYEGVASAPIVPALFASYKKDRIAVSGMIGIVGSGGFVQYDEGVPMFNVLLTKTISDLSGGLSSVTQGAIPPITPDQYTIDAEMLRPYFELSRVIDGVFGLANRLYGITFKENKDIPVYHPDVKAYEVFDKNGSYLAVLYADFHPREGKQGGAWMTEYQGQYIDRKGVNVRPHVSVVMNLTKPTEEKPSLLTLSEVETFLHEFGHSLHGMFA